MPLLHVLLVLLVTEIVLLVKPAEQPPLSYNDSANVMVATIGHRHLVCISIGKMIFLAVSALEEMISDWVWWLT